MTRVFAQNSVSLEQLIHENGISIGINSFGDIVNIVVRNAFVFAGIISFILLIFGSFQFIVSAGDAKKAEKGREAITGAVLGLLIVFGSFWIVQIIQKITGINILNPGV
jgi:hypothetical protein